MALSSPHFRSRPAVRRNRRKTELTPIFVPRLAAWRKVAAQDPELAERLVRAKRMVWAWCYVVGFGSGLLVARVVGGGPVMAASAVPVKTMPSAKAKKATPAATVATGAVKDPVVTIREVKR